MGNVVRVYSYARLHAEQAEKLLAELVEIRKKLHVKAERADDIYTDALANGDTYVPISFMRSDNEFNRYKTRMEEKQNHVVSFILESGPVPQEAHVRSKRETKPPIQVA